MESVEGLGFLPDMLIQAQRGWKRGSVSVEEEEEEEEVVRREDNTGAQHQPLFLAGLPHVSVLWRMQSGLIIVYSKWSNMWYSQCNCSYANSCRGGGSYQLDLELVSLTFMFSELSACLSK